ncbi:transmembrane protein 241-like [Gigantopelta aegis]|uniref:transmembrane protein 241-like n=1 Tax=Gigantopelta aegis TaxID=1735272 RepID=UPI001B88C59A|nr:transmembrane protein 241-like [Gigantopelta aegis]XP_041360834.1 transmembrane protein 241-like [Gigantopelta aegis]XP_041360835.1 transmembrane protein 241-like [Gigantopelta aegis]XP_041360836.1 transmembrane protein 241-like [Gigantopelta aegis]XP_041360838.1 transmembrane protein 241-like [Gigantopelta aegis]XP_041360839.1 transmembrane protein 241-like [Gigantopelta aegis]XP_041360840.1 transmembrane protein 241-like [Gigantopelta aegis]
MSPLWLRMDRPRYVVALCCLLFIGTNFVNKYVLSVLQFTYPTIFQGWQTLVGAIVLRILISTGTMEPLLSDIHRVELGLWLPGMIMFVTSIYSASKALAALPIPVFISLQNIVLVFRSTATIAITGKWTGGFVYAMLMLIIISSVAIAKTDPQFNQDAYFWMCVHIVSNGLHQIYSRLVSGKLKLSSHEKLYSSYIYSIIVLAPSSYFLGDALEASKFPLLFFAKFYMGCILSGVFGIFLSLSFIYLQDSTDVVHVDADMVEGVAKIMTSILSLLVFQIPLTGNHAIWLVVNHLCALACSESPTDNRPEFPFVQSEASTESHDSLKYLKRDELQQDMIRVDVIS